MQNRKTNLEIQNKNMFLIRKKLSLPQVRHSSAAVRDQSIMYIMYSVSKISAL